MTRGARCAVRGGLLLALAACGPRGNDPPAAMQRFIRAVKKHDCDAAFAMFTRPTQRDLFQRSKREIRQAPYYAEQFAPHRIECDVFATLYTDSPRLVSRQGDTAVVRVEWRVGTNELVPGFFPTKFVRQPANMTMVLEGGAWKVSLPHPRDPNPGVREIEVGPLTVEARLYPAAGHRWTGVRGPFLASAEAANAAFSDVASWPRWMPFVADAAWLDSSEHHERVAVRFAIGADTISAVMPIEIYRKSSDTDSWLRVGMHADTAANRLTPARGRMRSLGANLHVERHHARRDSATVDWGISADTTGWPSALADSILGPAGVVKFVRALEAEARRRRP